MTQATLFVQLYQIRMSEPYRSAARWFERELVASTWQELIDRYPRGSDDHDSLRLVVEHWELLSVLTIRGEIAEELVFSSTGEHLTVWSKVQPWIEDARTVIGDATFLEALEILVRKHSEWMRSKPPALARRATPRAVS